MKEEIFLNSFGIIFLLSPAVGVVLFFFGKKIIRQGDWLAAAFLFGEATVSLFYYKRFQWGLYPAHQKAWSWIWNKNEIPAVRLGFLQDKVGVLLAFVVFFISFVMVLQRKIISQKEGGERFNASVIISSLGVALAWMALTPWFGLLGVGLIITGGVISMSAVWHKESEANRLGLFLKEKMCGLFFLFLGMCVLASNAVSTVGVAILFVGLVASLNFFPFYKWFLEGSKSECFLESVLVQVYLGWAGYSFLYRLEPELRATGFLVWIGWYSVFSALLSILSGITQKNWKYAQGFWLSGFFSMAVAALCLIDRTSGVSLLLSGGITSVAFVLFGLSFDQKGCANQSTRKKFWFSKVGLVICGLSGVGFVGFLSSYGIIHLISRFVGISGLFFLQSVLMWKIIVDCLEKRKTVSAPWVLVLTPYFLLVLSFGFFWSASFSGFEENDLLVRLGFDLLVDLEKYKVGAKLWTHFSIILLSFIFVFWRVAEKKDFLGRIEQRGAIVFSFLRAAYRVDVVFSKSLKILLLFENIIEKRMITGMFLGWAPRFVYKCSRVVVVGVCFVQERFSGLVNSTIKSVFVISAKALQLIQNGGLQWHVFFALGSGMVLLVYFLRFG